jgi:hypothetical protein
MNSAFRFKQETAVPAYLIAIAAGLLREQPIGPRSSVWAEPCTLEAAAWEFAPAEQFISTGEEIAGPYVWGRYDVLVLPPSFPYGGMENPCLTFLTPSILAGDRSLVDVLAHEIAHSWTGNLVGCASWEHFWLNEGFTMFLERKIIARVRGEEVRQLDAHLGLADLREAVAQFGSESNSTRLVPDLSETSPDDVFSTVPYEKGHTLLAILEEHLGGPSVFEPFLRSHISRFAGSAIDSNDLRRSLTEHFATNEDVSARLAAFPWGAWLYAPGMPPVVPSYSLELAQAAIRLSQQVFAGEAGIGALTEAYDALGPIQRVLFFDQLLQGDVGSLTSKLCDFWNAFSLHTCRNVEILLKWHTLAIRSIAASPSALPPDQEMKLAIAAASFATRHGRMKYCRSILREMHRAGGPILALAHDTFKEHRAFFHPIAVQMIEKDLEIAGH